MRKLILLMSLASLGGCKRGPGADHVRKDLSQRLEKHFGKGLFSVAGFNRRGHYPYTEAEENRVLIYYTAELKLQRDHKLTDWNKLNVGSLASVLGSGPRGVKGVRVAGNKKGDLLKVNGVLAYRGSTTGNWESAVYRINGKGGKSPGEDRVLPYRKELQRIQKVGKALQKRRVKNALEEMTGDLRQVAAAAERRLGKVQGRVTLATGEPGGEYHRQGQVLAKVLAKKKHPAQAYGTAGSLENCRLVARGEVHFGYAQNDIAAMAYRGEGSCADQVPLSRLRALCSLYPEAVQLVTLANSSVQSVADLRGKRVNLGPAGSGARGNALQVLSAAGLKLADLGKAEGQSLAVAVQAMRNKKIDALFFTSAVPNPELRRLAEGIAVRVVSLDEATIAALAAKYPYLIPVSLPKKTYAKMKELARTVGVTAMLVTRDDTSDERVQTVLST
ncbi:MAG: TAXI family TRAP transporter solute-binding subunit, partial [Deltaproteobacteria bacterium]|nr:TAXI family TRAP transporter solute-binding subunit [Deltaproteobacteria bacterium]